MNAPCSFNTLTVEASPNAERPFLGFNPSIGRCDARLTADRRSLEVEHPQRGWISRPLTGLNSWLDAWNNDQINIYICTKEGWTLIESWDDFIKVL